MNHSVPCCPSNISRTLLSLPMWMYARSNDAIQVNLFVGSTVTVPDVAGTDVEVVQETDHPWDGRVAITVNPAESRGFTMRIRVLVRDPSALYTSAPDANGLGALRLNGSAISPPTERGYAVITRTWEAGDRIEFEVPMRIQRVHADERIEEDRGKVALRYGPLVYNIEQPDQDITQALPASAQLGTEWRADLLGGVMTISVDPAPVFPSGEGRQRTDTVAPDERRPAAQTTMRGSSGLRCMSRS